MNTLEQYVIEFQKYLYADCYHMVAQKTKWRNRDFDNTFDREVDALFRTACLNAFGQA